MKIKILQLNIWQGKFLDNIISFIQKEDFDILQFQEVTGGKCSKGGLYRYPRNMQLKSPEINQDTVGIDCFAVLKEKLGFDGVLAIAHRETGDPNSYEGNTTLFKKEFKVKKKEIIWLKEYDEVNAKDTNPKQRPRNALILQLTKDKQRFYIINTHLAWGPTADDEDYKLAQAKKLYERIKKLHQLFILTGDFNVDKNSQIVSWFGKIARNLTVENHIDNTLNPKIHTAFQRVSHGFTVDYIFTSPSIKINSFSLVKKYDLSDHLGLIAEIEI